MSLTGIILLCLHCFCFGGVVFGSMEENKGAAAVAGMCWFIVIVITLTRYLVLL